jgi:GntP family gluconate:H+ symporter
VLASSCAALVWPGGWAEPFTLVTMLLCFGFLTLATRWPIGVSLLLAAWCGAAVNGHPAPVHHLVEGAFAYLDPILMIGTAMVFMRFLADGKALRTIGDEVEGRFGHRPVLLLPMVMVIAMFPGMMTGSSTAAVLTTGGLCGSILVGMGLSRERAAAFVAMGGILGDVAPPISIPAMIIGSGLDLPYVGFTAPLALVAFPVAIGVAYGFGWTLLRSPRAVDDRTTESTGVPLWRAFAPLAVAAILMVAPRVAPRTVPDLGLPLIFLVASGACVLLLPRFSVREAALSGVHQVLPVLGILVGVGAFIQVMTLTGARGWLLSLMLGVPTWAMIMAAGVSIPLFGAVSAYGSASVLGVPFLIALIGHDEVVTTAALAGLASLGDLMLPAALAVTLAAQVVGVPDRMQVLRRCVLPAVLTIVWAVVLLAMAPQVGRLLP